MKKKIIFATSIFLCSIFTSITAETVEEIVSKHIEAIGGKENWAKIKSMRTEGTMKAQGAEVKIINTQIDKKALRTDIALMGMTGYSILTDKEGWSYMPFAGQTKPEPMTADDVKSSQDQLFLQDKFINYKEMGKTLEFIGKEDMDGTECLKLKMTDKDAKETTFFIDPSNYYIIKQTEKIKANGKEMESVATFSNYKKTAEGVVFPMTVSANFGEMEITKIEINPAIDETIFKIKN